MKFWITEDPHLGHDKIHRFCGRPQGFEMKYLKALSHIPVGDVHICLGDVAWREEKKWNDLLISHTFCKNWLVLGNHDRRGFSWYLERGWDFVGNQITLEIFGATVIFSHRPIADTGYTWNVHGHFHNNDHRTFEPELVAIKNDKQIRVSLEWANYQPLPLETLLKGTHTGEEFIIEGDRYA